MTNWKTTANGVLALVIGTAGPLAAYLAVQNNPKMAWASGIVTLIASIARVWVGILQTDSPTPNQIGQIAITSVASGTPPLPPSAINTSSVIPPKVLGILLCVFLALPLMGCKTASTNPPTAPGVTALTILSEVQTDVLAVQNAEIAAVGAGLIDQTTNQTIQKAFKTEAVDATALARAIESASTPATVQAKVDALLSDLQNDVTTGVLGIKDAKTQAEISALVAVAEVAVNGIMNAYGK